MSNKYECVLCNYDTTLISCYKKHLITKKHIMKVNPDIVFPVKVRSKSIVKTYSCEYCNKTIENKSNKARHLKQCINKYNTYKTKAIEEQNLIFNEKIASNIEQMINDKLDMVAKCSTPVITNNTNITNIVNNNNNKCMNFYYIQKHFKNPCSIEECLALP